MDRKIAAAAAWLPRRGRKPARLVSRSTSTQPNDLRAAQKDDDGVLRVYRDEKNPRKATARRSAEHDAEHYRRLAAAAKAQGNRGTRGGYWMRPRRLNDPRNHGALLTL